MTIRKILAPTDFSTTSRLALAFAADLARRYEASITLLHVYQVPSYMLPDGIVTSGPEAVAELLAKVGQALETARKETEGLGVARVETATAQGIPFAEIVKTAREGQFDLIVCGTHGRTGLPHALLGSVAERVVRKAHCPVLTVRDPEHRFELP